MGNDSKLGSGAVAEDVIVTLDMLCERLRPIVLGGRDACLRGTPMIPLHIATVTAIYQHLEDARLKDIPMTTTPQFVRPVRYHKKADGILRCDPDGRARFLTLWERIGLFFGGRP
jgi:hypothetical protein